MNVFDIKNLTFSYDKYDKSSRNILSDINLSITENDFMAIVGKSGSGKSTLINHLNGILKADSGDIIFKGKSIYSNDFDLTRLRFNCGLVFQYPDYQLFSETVLEDVCFGALKMGMNESDAKNRSLEVMKRLGIEDLKDASPFNLSGGEKRKVALAGVLVMRPDVLILDEPEAGLDSKSKKELFDFLEVLNKEKNITIIFTTHNYDDVMEYANTVVVLNEGKLIKSGKPYDVFSDESIIKSCDLDMPYAVQIAKKMINMGIKINTDSLRSNDIINALSENSK